MKHGGGNFGFTLIELLVVISIVALLSSIVLASLNSARDKGNVAAGQKFASSLQNAYGPDAIIAYNFDEVGATSIDSSTNLNNGTHGLSPVRVDGIKGKALQMNGTNYVRAANLFTTAMIQPYTKYMASAWIYPTEATTGTYYVFLGNMPGIRYMAYQNGQIRMMVNTAIIGPIFPIFNAKVPLNKWTHVAVKIQAGVGYSLYINGVEEARVANTMVNIITPPPAIPFEAGNDTSIAGGAVQGFEGMIDEVAVYGIE